MVIHQMDVKTAFLHGNLSETVYMKQPEGFIDEKKKDMVCLLKKSIYGLKQSPRCWNQTLHNQLMKMGFNQTESEPCIYVRNDGKDLILLAVYVDDLLLAGKSETATAKIKAELARVFTVKDMGELHHFLGMRVKQGSGYIWIGQDSYTKSILEKFNMAKCRSTSTPMDPGAILEKAKPSDPRFDQSLYQAAIGSLLYLAIYTRPDIAYAVGKLAQYCSDPTVCHWKAIKHLLRYLQGTPNFGIKYTNDSNDMTAYADADFGGDRDDRKSTSGFVIMKNNGPISWKSKKQTVTAQSTAEAELIALNLASRETAWFRLLMNELGKPTNGPVKIFEDNQSAIAICKNPMNHQATKHVAIKLGFTTGELEAERIEIDYIPTDKQLADIFTKPLRK